MKAVLLFLVGIFISTLSYAEIYKYVDEAGQVTYSNLRGRGAQRLNLEPAPKPVAPADNAIRKKSMGTPASFPRVDSDTQRKRDDVRRTVLEEELRVEERNLADARAAHQEGLRLRPGEQPGSTNWRIRTEKLSHAIRLHEGNIAALKKELASIR